MKFQYTTLSITFRYKLYFKVQNKTSLIKKEPGDAVVFLKDALGISLQYICDCNTRAFEHSSSKLCYVRL